ncbi:MAG: pectinesterase family protein [Bacteroidales bacterium]|nr:pectinesterase family protein [Bacteroidales bacterium]
MVRILKNLCAVCLALLGTVTSAMADDVTATWDFKTMVKDAVKIEGTTGSVDSDIEGISLTVDATSGKLATRGSDAQFSTGAKIKVPVKSTSDVVTVVSYPNYHYYTIGGKDAAADSEEHKATSSEVNAGYVEIVATNTAYLYTITVLQKETTGEAASYDNVATTIVWALGDEATPKITGAVDAVSSKIKVGSSLEPSKMAACTANSNEMTMFNPTVSKAGNVSDVVIEYIVKMPKGVTFKPTSISYDAVKKGTSSASHSWSYTVDGVESSVTNVVADDVRRDNSTTPDLTHSAEIDNANAGKTVTLRIYASGHDASKALALGNVTINGIVNGTEEPRAFTDFKLDFRTNPYTVVAPAELPTGVVLENLSYNGNQYGLGSAKVTVPVDGPVRFTIGSCQYGSHTVTVKNGDVVISTIDNNNGCENGVSDIAKATYNNYVVWTYNVEEAATLTFELNGFLPFLFAEACDYIEQVDVTYYDVDGTKIGTKTIDGGSALVYAYGAEDVKVPAGKAFRGWFASTATNALKVAEGKAIEADLKLYARATDIETVAVGTVQEYDLTKNYFYIEDHENISAVNGKYHDNQHGFDFAAGGSLSVKVAGKAQVVASLCKYTKTDCKVTVTDENAKVVAEFDGYNEADGAAYAFNYLGDATTLTFTFSNVSYLHNLKVYNVENFVEKDAATGMYIIPAGDASSLLLALNNANSEGGTIFLPNGLYDLGATALTAVSSNVSIIGESMEGVVIKNRPVKEGIAITATLLLTGSNIYIQDVTLDCIAPYGTGDDTKSAERGVVIQDKGTNNILKNVYLKGLQDTYYSNGAEGMKGYFENCKIEGTVDFICGSGTVFFEQCLLYVADRTKSNSANVITAPNGYQSEKGYVFNGCKIDATANQTGIYNFGRPWNKYSTAAFINTTMLKAGSSDGWTSMNKVDGIRFHEFGTVDANGDAVTGHNLSKCETTGTKEELYLSSADGYDVVSILGDWAATAKAATVQAIADPQAIDADALYLVEDKDGNFVTIVKGEDFDADANAENTIRKANARGGFGEAVAVTNGTGTAVEAENADKEIVAIEYYSLSGQKMASPARGVNMVVKVYGDGTKSAQKVVVK